MKRFKNILFVAQNIPDGSNSLKIAASLAIHNRALLTVVSIANDLSTYMNILPASSKISTFQEQMDQEHIERLERFVAPYRKGVKMITRPLKGTPFLEIIRQVIKKNHDLVVITPEGFGGLSETLFGSTTMHLMRKCPCPVWAIRPGQDERFSRVLAAVDFDPSNNEAEALNKKIADIASSLSRFHKCELHIVHAWHSGIRGMGIPRVAVHDIDAELRTAHTEWFDDFVRRYLPSSPRERTHLIEGEASSEIPGLVKKIRADLVVMGTVSRTGISGYLIGDTAEKILHRLDCSVFAIKPDKYVSPVKAG